MMMIDHVYHENLTPKTVDEILEAKGLGRHEAKQNLVCFETLKFGAEP